MDIAEHAGDHRAQKCPEQEHVDAHQRGAPGPEPIGDDRGDHSGQDGECGPGKGVGGAQEYPEQKDRGHPYPHHLDGAEGDHEGADEDHGPGGVLFEQGVGPLARHRGAHESGQNGEGSEHPPLERAQLEVLLEMEVDEDDGGEDGEADGRHAGEVVVERLDLLEPLERHRQRDGQFVFGLIQFFAQNGLHLVAAPPGLAHEKGAYGQGDAQDPHG